MNEPCVATCTLYSIISPVHPQTSYTVRVPYSGSANEPQIQPKHIDMSITPRLITYLKDGTILRAIVDFQMPDFVGAELNSWHAAAD